ncbi:MAG: hypothetical protein A2X71_04030 [Thiobacillus sp. GWE1_62_9]|nr:MAG: hypothetical protein A2X71_04030 [Thiobacillus sp. GWE1_62_9]
MIVCEDTYAKTPSSHLLKKKVLFDRIQGNETEFVEFLTSQFPIFKAYVSASNYKPKQFEVRILYCSRYSIPVEHKELCTDVRFIEYPLLRYFTSLVKTINKTAKFEIFKFLGLNYRDIGKARIKGRASAASQYPGFLLPEAHSNFPPGFKVLSFYVDPESLLERVYVLRKDSWEEPDCSYQRMLVAKKIRSMRRYLNESERVYVNNLIVTLPPSVRLSDELGKKLLIEKELTEIRSVKIELPDEFNSVGVIDGQHRVYSYHEGSDIYESKIRSLRQCQNLLVTAIMYPETVSDLERTRFEATLFLEINDEQTKARGDLKQAIELIVRPFSSTAISKSIISGLSRRGPLRGCLEEHYFDDDHKVKTSSIVSYGLKPLIKTEGEDSLYSVWGYKDKQKLLEASEKAVLDNYVQFCVKEINDLLLAAKLNLSAEDWRVMDKTGGLLTPTFVNGFIVCLREIVRFGLPRGEEQYKKNLEKIARFPFRNFKSSHWKQLGLEIFKQYFQ